MTSPQQPANSPGLTPAQIRDWLSIPRFNRYLAAAGNDPGRAFALYDWNSHVAGATLVDVGHLEVALRNVYDDQLSSRFPQWAIDPTTALFTRTAGHPSVHGGQQVLNQGSQNRLAAARAGLGQSPTHGQVVAALDFGFWSTMTRRERTATFWTPMLAHAFPSHLSRGRVHNVVDKLRKFRNRLAHNEPMFSSRTGLADRLRELDTLFSWIRPVAATWVRQRSAVPGLLAKCPVPGLVVVPATAATPPASTGTAPSP